MSAATSQATPLLKVEGLRVSYGGIQAVKGVSFEVHPGELVCLIGANGAGKSTTLKTISGLRPVATGSVIFDGQDITKMPAHKRTELGLCQAPEGRGIFPGMTVLENLEMGTYTRKSKDAKQAEELEHVFELFPRLKERISQHGGTLSGGEQQMLAIGRALMGRPELLMLDEPSLGLAPRLVGEVMAALAQLHQEGLTILLVEQNAQAALEIADRGYVLDAGTLTLEGTAAELLGNPALREAYLGSG